MAAVAAVVAASVRDVVRLLVDVALIFETVGARIGRLAVPITAFVSVYALLVITFASFYRIADGLSPAPIFASAEGPLRLDFADALHFSVATQSTVGYGDIRPVGDGVRVLASLQVLLGQLLLLFGFAEIMRGSRTRWREDGDGDRREGS
nr:ion channel [Caldovatus aquaticus]